MGCRLQFTIFLVSTALLLGTVRSDLMISRVIRFINLSSRIVKTQSSLEIENVGPTDVSQVLLAFDQAQANNLSALEVFYHQGAINTFGTVLTVKAVDLEGKPSNLMFYSVTLPKDLKIGDTATLDVLTISTYSPIPSPLEAEGAKSNLHSLVYSDNMYYTSPYPVKDQFLFFKIPGHMKFYTKDPTSEITKSMLKYGAFWDQPAFSYLPVVVHFENNYPFIVADELTREIEAFHNNYIQVTEQYTLYYVGARMQEDSPSPRINHSDRSVNRLFSTITAALPPRAFSVYCSHKLSDRSPCDGDHVQSDFNVSPSDAESAHPKFASFTLGYKLPLPDFLFKSDEDMTIINITYGSPLDEILVKRFFLKVVLSEGSKNISVVTPFLAKQSQEVKYSHLGVVKRPMVVVEKSNMVPVHTLYFQVSYRFNNNSLPRKPVILFTLLFLFVTCFMFLPLSLVISKTPASHNAREQQYEVQQLVPKNQCMKME